MTIIRHFKSRKKVPMQITSSTGRLGALNGLAQTPVQSGNIVIQPGLYFRTQIRNTHSLYQDKNIYSDVCVGGYTCSLISYSLKERAHAGIICIMELKSIRSL